MTNTYKTSNYAGLHFLCISDLKQQTVILKNIFIHLKFNIMKNLRNSVTLIGRLGFDPEIKNLDSGKKLAKMSIATDDSYRDASGNKVEQTQWHQVIAWGKTAEIAEKYLKKGKEVAIEGKLVHRNYEDKDGNKKYITEVNVNEILMLGGNAKS
jgi:single-strand DNA-binding protein